MDNPLNILSERAASATANLVNCRGCTTCCERGGLVHVNDSEIRRLSSLGVPLMTIEGATFIERRPDSCCPMLDKAEKKCSIYSDRPLCCRLFPLDVLKFGTRLKWAVSDLCPDERKHFENSQGPESRLGMRSLALIASGLNTTLDAPGIEYLKRKELTSARVEILERTSDRWTPLVDCVVP